MQEQERCFTCDRRITADVDCYELTAVSAMTGLTQCHDCCDACKDKTVKALERNGFTVRVGEYS